jgi:hypothetical protein
MTADPGTALNDSPEVHFDAGGAAIANWTSSGPGGTGVRYAQLPAGSEEFGETQTIEGGSGGRLAMAPSGTAVMIWKPPSSTADIRYSFRPPGAAFGVPMTLVEPDDPLNIKVAMAPDGSAVAAWSALKSPNEFVRWAAAPPGGPFGSPAPITPGGEGVMNDLEMSAQGTALALWADSTAAMFQMRASLRPAGGAFGEPAVLPGPPQGVNLFGGVGAFDPEGNAAALWRGLDPLSEKPHDVPLLAAGLDAAGPRLEGLKVPARGRDDRRVTMSMAPIDVWSAVASTHFAFGDRMGAPGPMARHRYRAGRYSVTAGATDAVGNTTTATRVLKVSDATRPRIRGLRVRPRRIGVNGGGASRASRKPGSTIRLRLSERARVRFVVQRPRPGKAKGRKRFKRVGSFVRRNLKRGRNRIGFAGRVGHKTLLPGAYRLVAVAIDRAKRRSRPARTRFSVAPGPSRRTASAAGSGEGSRSPGRGSAR